jgi:hypothetical protein
MMHMTKWFLDNLKIIFNLPAVPLFGLLLLIVDLKYGTEITR